VKRSHWVEWHDDYEDPNSPLSARLAEVQRQLRVILDEAPEGQLRLIAFCAGRGRDVLDVLGEHARGRDVTARLVELDAELANDAALLASERGLDNVDVVNADASRTDAYAGVAPADIVMVCGVFGNISMDDIGFTIATLPSLCAPGAHVIWTRHRRPPDWTPTIRANFRDCGFREVDFATPQDYVFCVGTQQLVRPPDPFVADVAMFAFSGDGAGPA
jgi:hypothetical protein